MHSPFWLDHMSTSAAPVELVKHHFQFAEAYIAVRVFRKELLTKLDVKEWMQGPPKDIQAFPGCHKAYNLAFKEEAVFAVFSSGF